MMFSTRDMQEAFTDWLERDQIERALITARPDLAEQIILDEGRPVLRIPSPRGGFVVVAKPSSARSVLRLPFTWVVGMPSDSGLSFREPDSREELVALVLAALDDEDSQGGADTAAGTV